MPLVLHVVMNLDRKGKQTAGQTAGGMERARSMVSIS